MPKKIKVLFVTAELTPIAKAGGLADVAEALPKALSKLDIDIRVLMPYHECITNIKAKKYPHHLIVPFGRIKYQTNIFLSQIPHSKVPVYLIHHDKFISHGPIYPHRRQPEKYMFFSQALAEFLKQGIFEPDVLHINDWHAANGILLLKKEIGHIFPYKTLLTIHNLAMRGKIPMNKTKLWHPSLYKPHQKGKYNTMQQILNEVDLINTVSPQYAKEILTHEYGCGLDGTLRKNKIKLSGIINGIDYDLFSPQKDPYIVQKFNYRTVNKKQINKKHLQRMSHLPADLKLPIFGIVTRIKPQKGIDLIVQIIPELEKLNAQFVFTGVGLKSLESQLQQAEIKYPHKFYFLNRFDIIYGQDIYAGADFFLMPSKFEPCGLGQLIAMAYGTLPIVRATGGLKDTVFEKRNGFVFKNYDPKELLQAIKRAIKIYQDKKTLKIMIQNAMQADHSWTHSALEYKKLYHKLLEQ